jgi:hypothetical protein
VEAMREMLAQEMDYVQEARNVREASALFTPADGIVVPKVYGEYSSERVLTMEYIRGRSFREFLSGNPSQEERDDFGTKISRAWFRMYYANASYADPHTGNYIFMDGGRLGLLDFGCIQHFTPDDLGIIERGEAYLDGRMTLEQVLLADGYYSEEDVNNPAFMAPLRRHHAWLTGPSFHEGPFDFSDPAYLQQGTDSLQEMVAKIYPSPPMYLYVFRSMFGLKILSYRLACRVDIRKLRAEERKARG